VFYGQFQAVCIALPRAVSPGTNKAKSKLRRAKQQAKTVRNSGAYLPQLNVTASRTVTGPFTNQYEKTLINAMSLCISNISHS
jgi:outer membrane protein TolC